MISYETEGLGAFHDFVPQLAKISDSIVKKDETQYSVDEDLLAAFHRLRKLVIAEKAKHTHTPAGRRHRLADMNPAHWTAAIFGAFKK